MSDAAAVRHVSDDERRARLAVRHALAPGHEAASAEKAARAMTVLHASEPATVHLACWARVAGLALDDVDAALYADRSLVRQLGMRRTLFAAPADLLPAIWSSAALRVERDERRLVARDLAAHGVAEDADAWLAEARRTVLEALASAPGGLTVAEARDLVGDLGLPTVAGPGPAVGRVVRHLGVTGDALRGANTSHWRVLRPKWVPAEQWLPGVRPEPDAATAWRELVRRWLWTFGPGTEADVVWWLGATKGIVRRALTELEAVPVRLDDGATGWLSPGDDEAVADPGPWAALLPVLDPTVMGWKERDFYLGTHRERLFDRNGNAGTTAWVDGRVVGFWTQDEAGRVAVGLVEDVPAAARRALDAQAARLTEWLDGTRVTTTVPSPAMRAAASS